ncbi:septum site-determining protein Ssd [Saccharothrix longispora]|uniref:Secretion/DNA translocation related CpaE-like protein n=1 Tax=Saccharothrix longispora TaxID=33920 RepID=A0ABU1Q470_9PSEU|nr:septum site-determining protein Ssd [Saccharothrix longispora]MDR6597671.1 secretion/DNA translocation related CpaE-like protein [Saccharothrix longispora]
MERPVVLVSDAVLLDEVLHAAAVVGCEVERVADAPALRARWHAAPVVVLDEASAGAAGELPRRPGVHVVATGPPGEATWRRAVALGAEQVLELPTGQAALRAAFADALDGPSGDGRVLAVLGARGGAGASVLAVAVGQAVLSSGGHGLLVDCDPLGGGLDLTLGAERQEGLRWPTLHLKGGRVPAAALRSALPGRTGKRGSLTVLSCGRTGPGPEPAAVVAVVEAGRRAGGTVVCDVPRQLTAAACAALDRADLAIMVVPADVKACMAAQPLVDQVTDRGVRLRAVVRGPSPGGLTSGEVAEAVDLPLLTSMRPARRLAAALDQGRFPDTTRGPLAKAAREVLAALNDH